MFSRRFLLGSILAFLAGEAAPMPAVVDAGEYRHPASVGYRRWLRWSDGRCSFVDLGGRTTTVAC